MGAGLSTPGPANTLCAGGVYADAAALLTSFAPAQTYCSSKFPVPATTTTITASTSTVYLTIATVSLTSTTATSFPTVTASAVTETVTPQTLSVTATVTVPDVETITVDTQTVTATVSVNAKVKRSAATTSSKTVLDPKASAWSSVIAQASAFVAKVCTCLEQQVTVTTTSTPLFTLSVTGTSIIDVIATSPFTSTPTDTISVTATSTITQTATATSIDDVTATATATQTVIATLANPCDTSVYQCGSNSQCTCYDDTNGGGFCALASGTCGKVCSSDKDCPAGAGCLTDTTCGEPTCANPIDLSSCPVSGSAKMLFVRGQMYDRDATLRQPLRSSGT